jgi:large subunit ribosomal protein L25
MKSVALKAYPRSVSGRNAVKKIRTSGRVPATIYGRNLQPQNLEVQTIELSNLLKHSASENILVDLAVDGAQGNRLALMQEIQHDSLSGSFLHVDFHEIKEDEKVTISVPVEATGEAAGVKAGGGVLEHVMFKLRVRALPKDLPEQINVDVSALEIGKSIHIGEITAPTGVEIIGKKEAVVFSVAAPVAEVEAAPAAEGDAAKAAGAVEMLKEKKEDGAAPAAGAAKKDEKAAPAKK